MLELCQRLEVNYNSRLQTNFSLRSINTNSYSLKSLDTWHPKFGTVYHKICGLQTAFPNLLGRLNHGYLIVVLVFYVAHILVN